MIDSKALAEFFGTATLLLAVVDHLLWPSN